LKLYGFHLQQQSFGFALKSSEGFFHTGYFPFAPHSLQVGGYGGGSRDRQIEQHSFQGVALGLDLLGHLIRNGVTQTLQMRRKDRFKYRKKLANQFVVIVHTIEQLRYIEDRQRSDIHFVAPSLNTLSDKPADADKNGIGARTIARARAGPSKADI
jgi:hypothetical protein